MMCNPGVKEKQVAQEKNTPEQNMKGPWLGNLATFHEYRAKGAPIGFAPTRAPDMSVAIAVIWPFHS